MKKILIAVIGLLIFNSYIFAQDISIDSQGNLVTGSSNSNGNLEVVGTANQDGIVSTTSGTGAAGVYGGNTTSNNYGILGDDNYGVYGNSGSGYAGYFQGHTRVTGNLTVDGTISMSGSNADTLDGLDSTDFSLTSHNHDAAYVNEGQANSITGSMITDGTIQQGDLSFSIGSSYSLNAADGSPTDVVYVDNIGNVGVGTTTPSGKLDVIGDICLGAVCRSTWPTGSGVGAFTDSGSSAYYTGGNVGIGTSSPSTGTADGRGLHIVKAAGSAGDIYAGVRLEIDGVVDSLIASTYNGTSLEGGLLLGTVSNHRIGFGTNGTEKMTILSNGNVGIGKFDPLHLLHVQGNAYVNDNLGIGVASPSYKLQVSGSNSLFSSDTGDFKMYMSKNATSNYASLFFQDNYSGRAEIGLTGNNNLHFKVSSDGINYADAMIIDHQTGNVAIGIVDTSEGKLEVVSHDTVTIYAENEASNADAVFIYKNQIGNGVHIFKQNTGGNALKINHRGSDPAILVRNKDFEVMAIEGTNGHIGVGTTSPTAMLDLNGSTGYGQLRIRSAYTPTGTGDTNGNTGDVTWDEDYIYVKTAGGWKRSALTSW